jgi:hypothetical protein
MNPRRGKEIARKLAVFAAVLLLVGQTIAASHFHPASRQLQVSSSSATGIADSACAICAAHLHSSAAAAIAPAIDAPTSLEKQMASAIFLVAQSACIANCFGRAPPASV